MSLIDMRVFEQTARKDFEFTRETRYLNGAVKIGIAGEDHVLSFADGRLESVDQRTIADGDCKIIIRGDADTWKDMLAEKPRPFFQSLQSTAVKHGLSITDTNETFAYLPGLNRMMVLMRQIARKG